MEESVRILMNVKVSHVVKVVYVIISMAHFNAIVNLVFRNCLQIQNCLVSLHYVDLIDTNATPMLSNKSP